MTDQPTRHPADAAPEELTYGQRITRQLFPDRAILQDQRKCIQCGIAPTPEQIATWTPAGQREWNISGMGEDCFDATFADIPDPDDYPTFPHSAVQPFRSPSALAIEASVTPATYGDHCYFCSIPLGPLGDGSLAEAVSFVLRYVPLSSTDEWSCQPCMDRVLRTLVFTTLDSAVAEGYDLDEWPAEEVTSDLWMNDETLKEVPQSILLPHVEAWLLAHGQ